VTATGPPTSESGTEPTRRSAQRLELRIVVALGVVAIVESTVVRHLVYPALSWNRDEAAYLWQAGVLRSGHLVSSTGGTPTFFQPWLTGILDAHFFSQYTLGWPGLMALSQWIFGSPSVAIPIGVTLAVVGTYAFVRVLAEDRTLALVTSVLVLVSPIVILQSGVYLSYMFGLGLGTSFGAMLLAGVKQHSRGLIVGAGAVLGLTFLARPLDAVLWAVAVGGYVLFTTWRSWSRQLRIVAQLLVGLAPFVVVTLLHNRAVTGRFTEFPFTAKEALDTFGFGVRRLMPQEPGLDYTVGEALRGTVRNTWYLPQFLAGTYVAVALGIVGLWLRRRDRSTIALLLVAVAFPFGYFWFWGNRGSSGFAQFVGPIYFIPVYVPLCVLAATALIALWRHKQILAVAVCCLAVAGTAPFLVDRLRSNARASAAQAPWRDATDQLPGRVLVFVEGSGPYLLKLNPFSANDADLGGRVLYATDQGARNIDLVARHPHRRPYVERTSSPSLNYELEHRDAPTPKVTVQPLKIVRGAAVTLRVRVRGAADATTVVQLRVGSQPVGRTFVAHGASVAEWHLVPAGSASAATDTTIPADENGQISIVAGSGTREADALSGAYAQIQYAYRARGSVLEVLEPGRPETIVGGAVAVGPVHPAVPTLRVEAL
jgi:4-amino-4-deoxy-L-arabinose transferase-like glycosyltransferase